MSVDPCSGCSKSFVSRLGAPVCLSGLSMKSNGFSMDGDHLVVTCILSTGFRQIPTFALIDCGATGYAFIDSNFVR